MIRALTPVRIADAGTHTLTEQSCSLRQLVIGVDTAGSSWTLKIRDKASTPRVLLNITIALPTDLKPLVIFFDDPIRMDGGIDAITAGTPGALAIWATVERQ